MYFTVYSEFVLSKECKEELSKIRYWCGPCIDGVYSYQLYTKSDAEKFVKVLRKYNVKLYRRRRVSPTSWKYEEVPEEVQDS